jgi:uncharacterized integral membrane protein
VEGELAGDSRCQVGSTAVLRLAKLQRMNRIKIVAAAVLVILLIVLMVQNSNQVETHLLFAKVTMAQSILLLVTASLGFGSGALVTWFLLRRKHKKAAADKPA